MTKISQKTSLITDITDNPLDLLLDRNPACFIVINDIHEGEIINLVPGIYSLGRESLNSIQLYSQGISRKHLKITVTEEIVSILDLGSSNGTYVNKIKIKDEYTLSKGDVVTIGHSSLKFLPKNDGERINYEHFFKETYLDKLTLLYNKNFFLKKFPLKCILAQEKSTSVSLAMIDLDFFKSINDTHGHLIGDKVLKHFAFCLKQYIYNDIYRYGGEEIAVIFTKNLDEASFEINEVKNFLKNNPFSEGSVRISYTFSAGIANLKKNQSSEDLLAKADRALYSAKNNGRDQVCQDKSST